MRMKQVAGNSAIEAGKPTVFEKITSFFTKKQPKPNLYLVTDAVSDSPRRVRLKLEGDDLDAKLKNAKFLLDLKETMDPNSKEK